MPHWSLTYLLFALMLMDPHAAFAGKVNTGGPSELIPEISQTDQTVIKIGILAKRGREQILTKWSPTATYLERVIPGSALKSTCSSSNACKAAPTAGSTSS